MGVRVGIDLTALLPVATGVDNCLTGLVQALGEAGGEDELVLFVGGQDADRFRGLGSRFEIIPCRTRSRLARLAFQQLVLPGLVARKRLQVLHSPSFFMPLRRGRARHLLTVYDMTSFSRPQEHTRFRGSGVYRAGIRASIRRADLVVVPSHYVKADLLRRMGSMPATRVEVIPPGIGEEFRPGAEPRPEWPRPYVLFVGTIEPRKNLDLLLEAFAQLVHAGRPEHLLIAGQQGWGCEGLSRRIAALGDRARRLGYVPRADLPALYAGASACVYPSREEGFGLPPLEAMACGTPAVATRCSALAENLEGAAELVDPDAPAELAAAILRIVADPAHRARLVEAGAERARRFRWSHSASLTMDCYRQLAAGSGRLKFPTS